MVKGLPLGRGVEDWYNEKMMMVFYLVSLCLVVKGLPLGRGVEDWYNEKMMMFLPCFSLLGGEGPAVREGS